MRDCRDTTYVVRNTPHPSFIERMIRCPHCFNDFLIEPISEAGIENGLSFVCPYCHGIFSFGKDELESSLFKIG